MLSKHVHSQTTADKSQLELMHGSKVIQSSSITKYIFEYQSVNVAKCSVTYIFSDDFFVNCPGIIMEIMI